MDDDEEEPEPVRYRSDGWPLCPRCGEDELQSLATPPRADSVLHCLSCLWRGVVPPAPGTPRGHM